MNRGKQNISSLVLLNLVSPIIGLIAAFKNWKAYNIVQLSTLIMAVFGLNYFYDGVGDGSVHMEHAKKYLGTGFIEFFQEWGKILIQSPSGNAADSYIHVLYYLAGAVFKAPRMLHFFAAIPLGFIIGKTLSLLKHQKRFSNIAFNNGVFLFALIAIHGLFPLNAIRTGTAMWLALYASLGFAFTKKRKYMIYLLLTTQIHLAYGLIIVPIFAAIAFYRFRLVIVIAFLLSFTFTQVKLDFILNYLPDTEVVSSKKSNYVVTDVQRFNDDNLRKQEAISKTNFYARWGQMVYRDFGIFMLVLIGSWIYLKRKIDNNLMILIAAVLLLYTASNIVTIIPNLSGRLKLMGTVLLLPVFFLLRWGNLMDYGSRKLPMIYFYAPKIFLASTILILLKRLSYYLDMSSVTLLFAPILNLLLSEQLGFKQFIKLFL